MILGGVPHSIVKCQSAAVVRRIARRGSCPSIIFRSASASPHSIYDSVINTSPFPKFKHNQSLVCNFLLNILPTSNSICWANPIVIDTSNRVEHRNHTSANTRPLMSDYNKIKSLNKFIWWYQNKSVNLPENHHLHPHDDEDDEAKQQQTTNARCTKWIKYPKEK